MQAGNDAVLGSVEDGGYCLLSLNRIDERLFSGIMWSTAQVADETRRRLRELGWCWHELPALWDVDNPQDLARLKAWKAR